MLTSTNVIAAVKGRARTVFGDRRVRRLKVWRLRLAERLGVDRYRMPGLEGLDERLIERVRGARSKHFIEFGANDGVQQSNSYALERDHGWTGVLVEPVASLAAECAANRPHAAVVCAAVVADADAGRCVRLSYDDLMTSRSDGGGELAIGVTLSDLVDLLEGQVGLVVVDVEGGELDALAGLDLSRHRPEFILVETAQLDAVRSLLGDAYEPPEPLSYHDYLFAAR